MNAIFSATKTCMFACEEDNTTEGALVLIASLKSTPLQVGQRDWADEPSCRTLRHGKELILQNGKHHVTDKRIHR